MVFISCGDIELVSAAAVAIPSFEVVLSLWLSSVEPI